MHVKPLHLLRDFHAGLTDFVGRHPRAAIIFMGITYTVGDGMLAAMPAVDNGSVKTLIHLAPDWDVLRHTYLARPLPALASLVMVPSSIMILRERFAWGHAGQALGYTLLTISLFQHHEPWVAVSTMPGIVGGLFGTFYLPLEHLFGHASNRLVRNTLGSPKRMAGYGFFFSSIPAIFSSLLAGNKTLFIAASNWVAGNFTSTLLPQGKVEPDENKEKPIREKSDANKRPLHIHKQDNRPT